MKKKTILDLICNIAIVLSVSIGMSVHIFCGSKEGLDGGGLETLRYFTNLSNIFCALIALGIAVREIKMLVKKDFKPLGNAWMVLRQMAASGVAVTFITVAFIFLPLIGFNFPYLYSGQKILTHVTTPLLAILSFLFFSSGKANDWKKDFLSIIPEFLYGIVYEIQVPILNNWPDFYGFTLGGKWYAPLIVLPIICGMAYLCSFLLSLGHKAVTKKARN